MSENVSVKKVNLQRNLILHIDAVSPLLCCRLWLPWR